MEVDLTVQKLRAVATDIARRITDATYVEDPFWLARFGDRGRQRAYEDAAYHIDYLIQSLSAGEPNVMRGYARWLQSVLTTRGMCTQHLVENLERVEAAVTIELAGGADVVTAHLRSAREALLYTSGPARELQDMSAEVARRAALQMSGVLEERDMRHVVSYMSDAIALGRPELFEQYVRFATGFYAQRGASPGAMQRAVDLVVDGVRERGPSSSLATEVATIKTIAHGALEPSASP